MSFKDYREADSHIDCFSLDDGRVTLTPILMIAAQVTVARFQCDGFSTKVKI